MNRSIEHLDGPIGIRKSLPQVDTVCSGCQRAHLGENRRTETLQPVGEIGLSNKRILTRCHAVTVRHRESHRSSLTSRTKRSLDGQHARHVRVNLAEHLVCACLGHGQFDSFP